MSAVTVSKLKPEHFSSTVGPKPRSKHLNAMAQSCNLRMRRARTDLLPLFESSNRATPTAWFAPLPPGSQKPLPSDAVIVSPRRGSRSISRKRSADAEPTMTIFFAVAALLSVIAAEKTEDKVIFAYRLLLMQTAALTHQKTPSNVRIGNRNKHEFNAHWVIFIHAIMQKQHLNPAVKHHERRNWKQKNQNLQ